MDLLVALAVGTAGYLVGSISFARLVARLVAPGTDITRYELPIPSTDLVYEDDAASATLVNLNLGARWGCLTASLDMLKAAVPMWILQAWFPATYAHLLFAAMALVGHNWPVYHRFHGGRGESVVYGSMLVLDPLGIVAVNVGAVALGMLFGRVHALRWGGMMLLIPWLWWRTGSSVVLAYIVLANALFWIAMRKDFRQYYLYHRRKVFRKQEDLSTFLDMGAELGRFVDRYSLPALIKRWAG